MKKIIRLALYSGEWISDFVKLCKAFAKGRQQSLSRAMKLQSFDYSQRGSVEGRAFDCS